MDVESVESALYLYIGGGFGTGGGLVFEEVEEVEDEEAKWADDKRLAMTLTAFVKTAAADEAEEVLEDEDPEECWLGINFSRSSGDFFSALTDGGGVSMNFFSASRSTTRS